MMFQNMSSKQAETTSKKHVANLYAIAITDPEDIHN